MNEVHDLQTVPLLDAEQASTLRAQVFDLKDQWTRRHPSAPFYTLGAASYLDAAQEGGEAYERKAAMCNPWLSAHFQGLYDRLLATLTEHLGRPVSYAEGFALPGFHIYLADERFCGPVASVHYDLQYSRLDWASRGGYVPNQHVSMTLPIALPGHGSGLAHWPIRSLNSFRDDEERQRFQRDERRFQPYTVGELVFHSGHMLHQSVLMESARPGEDRITLQAHAALTKHGEYLVYW